MPHDDEGYTCVLTVLGDPPRVGLWKIVDRYGVPVPGEAAYVASSSARARAEELNAAVIERRFLDHLDALDAADG